MSAFDVRLAVAEDAEAIVRVHHAAVHGTAKICYPPEVIDAWAVKLTQSSYEKVRREIADEAMIVLIAEADSQILGFGMVVPDREELRAVYVHPDHGRRGVGGAILKQLEELASARGVARLQLASSVNAEAFYSKHGYEVLERTFHRLRPSHEMACVKMVKALAHD